MGPTGYGDSPYQSFSTFAGNPYFIDLDTLLSEGLLKKEELEGLSFSDLEDRVDYGKLYTLRFPVLDKAVRRFLERIEKAEGKKEKEEYQLFLEENAHWLPSYAAFMAKKMPYSSVFHEVCQFLFFRQWMALKAYANAEGIRIIGDIPIYVSMDSSDVLDHPD